MQTEYVEDREYSNSNDFEKELLGLLFSGTPLKALLHDCRKLMRYYRYDENSEIYRNGTRAFLMTVRLLQDDQMSSK